MTGSVVIGVITGLTATRGWQTWLLFVNRTSFHATDPQNAFETDPTASIQLSQLRRAGSTGAYPTVQQAQTALKDGNFGGYGQDMSRMKTALDNAARAAAGSSAGRG